MEKVVKIITSDPRAKIFGLLLLLWVIAFWRNPSLSAILFPLFSCFLFSFLDLIYNYWKSKKFYYPFSSLVSGGLLGMLIHPSQGILTLWSAVVLAFFSKHFIKMKGKHIFNPAAFGVVSVSLISGLPISWWVTAAGGISLILLSLSSFILYKLKRLQISLIFLLGYFLFMTYLKGLSNALLLTVDGTVFLFAFIMLPEPMTSTISGFWKYGFALSVLAIIILSYLTRFSFTDPLLIALLITNLLGRIFTK